MLTALALYGAASTLSAGVLVLIGRRAPWGYEDETGFHYGRPPAAR